MTHPQDTASSVDAAAIGGIAVDFDPFAGTEVADAISRVIEPTRAQREVWLADRQGETASLAYNEAVVLQLQGTIDPASLQLALDQVVSAHEALRAVFSADGSQMLVRQTVAVPMTVVRLEALDPAARVRAIEHHHREAVATPFDLVAGPLLRARLLVTGPDHAQWLLSAHHIVCDGYSFGIIIDQLAAVLRGEPIAPSAFGDYAIEDAAREDTPAHRDDIRYWTDQFAGGIPALDLPADRPRPARRDPGSRRVQRTISPDITRAARARARTLGISLFTLLHGGFALLIARLADSAQTVIGVPSAGQSAADMPGIVGHCVNLLPVRNSVPLDQPADAWLRDVQSILLDAFDHQRFTYGTLLAHLPISRDPSRLPLVPVMFNLDQAIDPATLASPGLSMSVDPLPRVAETFELFLNVTPDGEQLRLDAQFATALYDDVTVEGWLDIYSRIIESLANDPARSLRALPLLPAPQAQRLERWNETRRPEWVGHTVTALIDSALARHADAPALADRERSLTGVELSNAVDALARAVAAAGIGRGHRVGLCVDRGVGMVIAQLAILRAGAAFVPLDPGFPKDRLAYMVQDAALPLIICDASTAEVAAAIAQSATRQLRIDASGRAIDPDSPVAMPAQPAAEDPAYVIYTSGSTGRPKGVVVPHRAVANLLLSIQASPGIDPGDRFLAVTTLSFDIAMLELLTPLISGACVFVAGRDEVGDGDALVRRLTSAGINLMQATPGTWRLLLAAGWQPAPDFDALVGGEPLPIDLAEDLLARGVRLWNLYGPTETTIWSTCWACNDTSAGIRIGRPIGNTRVTIRGLGGEPMPIGLAGEIEIAGDGVTLGYHGRPELTAERFVHDEAGRPAYRTGDLGRWRHDGQLEHLGRLDQQVKVRGYRIELGEIEAVLADHPAVHQAVVTLQQAGPDDQRLAAFLQTDPAVIEPRAADREFARKLRDHLRQRLPDYMLPQHFVQVAAMPLLPNGKINRAALPKAWTLTHPGQASPGPAPSGGALPSAALPGESRSGLAAASPAVTSDSPSGAALALPDAAASPHQDRVATRMAEVLRLPAVTPDDDFFLLGGHSLLAAQLVTRLMQDLDRAIPLAAVFAAPTAATLAHWIDAHAADGPAPRIRARADRTTAPLSPMQQRVHFLETMNPGSPVYNTPSAHRLRGPMDADAFERAFNRIIAQQDVLRTALDVDPAGLPIQRILPSLTISLFPAEDLSDLAPAIREETLARRMRELAAEPIGLERSPLFQTRMFRLGPDEHVWFFMPHHVIWDGWSFDLLYRAMADSYAAEMAAAPAHAPALPPLPLNYGDYAVWQLSRESAVDAAGRVAHWTAKLDRAAAPLQLPADRPRPARMSGHGSTEWLTVDADQLEAARAFGRGHRATLFMVLLSAYVAMLGGLSGQPAIVVGTPARNREHPDLTDVMGFFVNALPLRFTLTPRLRIDDLIAQVRRVVLDAFDSPDVPVERIVRALELPRDESRGPLWQAFFSFQEGNERPLGWGGLKNEPIYLLQPGTADDLGLWFLGASGRLTGGLQYNTDIFDASRVQQMTRAWQALLDRLITMPVDTSLAELTSVLPASLKAGVRDMKPTATAPAAPIAAPLSDTEQQVAAVWRTLLGAPDVRRDDNFFDLGGHSMLVMQAIAQLEKTTGKRINPRQFIFESLAQVARAYDEAEPAPRRPAGLVSRIVGALRRRGD